MNGDTGNPEFLGQIKSSAAEIMRLLGEANTEANKVTAKLNDLNSRPPRNPAEAVKAADEFAPTCDTYANALENIIPHFAENIAILTDAYSGYIKSLDLETEAGRDEIGAINERLGGMIEAYKSTGGKVKTLRDNFQQTVQMNHTSRLTRSAQNLVRVLDEFSVVFEEIETFGLKTQFLTKEKEG